MSRLNSKAYRHEYVNGFQDGRLAAQILSMREKKGLSQATLAAELGTKQSRISQLETGNYDGWSVRMLRHVAAYFDVAVSVKFDSFPNVIADLKLGNASNLVPEPYVDLATGPQYARPTAPAVQWVPKAKARVRTRATAQGSADIAITSAANDNLALAA